ncbi:hypothetical protein PUN4_570185 [Paraburkholderia unamae]|nr:hypothetical protein PUN4_570185 [Paraburkholderia unamae]
MRCFRRLHPSCEHDPMMFAITLLHLFRHRYTHADLSLDQAGKSGNKRAARICTASNRANWLLKTQPRE